MASKRDKLTKSFTKMPTAEETTSTRTASLQSIVKGERPEYRYMKPSNIILNPLNDYNEEDSDTDIEELAKDISRNGLIHNLVVSYREKENSYVLLSGERRLRAIKLNAEKNPNDERWQEVYVQVRTNLTPSQENIILDAANIETRGSGAKGEVKYRKAITRFVENVKNEYNLTEDEAIKMAATFTGASTKTINRNLAVERNMVPGLLKLLDNGTITKVAGIAYANLTQEEQEAILANYEQLIAAKDESAMAQYSEDAMNAIKTNESVIDVKPKRKERTKTTVEDQTVRILKNCERARKNVSQVAEKADLLSMFESDNQLSQEVKDSVGALYDEVKSLWEKIQ